MRCIKLIQVTRHVDCYTTSGGHIRHSDTVPSLTSLLVGCPLASCWESCRRILATTMYEDNSEGSCLAVLSVESAQTRQQLRRLCVALPLIDGIPTKVLNSKKCVRDHYVRRFKNENCDFGILTHIVRLYFVVSYLHRPLVERAPTASAGHRARSRAVYRTAMQREATGTRYVARYAVASGVIRAVSSDDPRSVPASVPARPAEAYTFRANSGLCRGKAGMGDAVSKPRLDFQLCQLKSTSCK